MASETAVDLSGTATEAAETTTETVSKPHRLERKWTFWFDNQSKPKQGAAWGSGLRKAYTFDTVEEFWCLHDQIFQPSKFATNAEFHLFRAGIEPKWEDPECANGGKWTVATSRINLNNMWLETLMALIGEQFDDTDEICGVVASVRQRGDKLSLWTKTATNEAAQMGIGRKWKEVIDVTDKITYSFHDDSRRDRSAKGRYTVDEEAIPEQLRGVFGQAVSTVQQLPAPVRDTISSGLKLPLSGSFQRLFMISYLDDEILITRDTAGLPEVLTRLDASPSSLTDPLSEYES